ncbi:MAG: hypothetical protein IJJ40_01045 [Clostridia bacterium]|nr:hypothetical protein [Clostridia bacterium]
MRLINKRNTICRKCYSKSNYIYRYINYSEFLDILINNRLLLKYPGNWPDKLEMLFLKSFETARELDKLSMEYRRKYLNYSIEDTKSDFKIISSLLIRTRCQCWTYKEDDLNLWNDRHCNESVRIGVNKNIFDHYKSESSRHLVHKDVIYTPSVNYQGVVNKFAKGGRQITDLVTIKKSVFEYEHEHRLVLLPDNYGCSTHSYGDTLSENLHRYFLGVKSEFGSQGEYISFDPHNIVSVKASPYSSDEFSRLVENDCVRFNLKYEGVSNLLH